MVSGELEFVGGYEGVVWIGIEGISIEDFFEDYVLGYIIYVCFVVYGFYVFEFFEFV